jgi:hypothetical protein
MERTLAGGEVEWKQEHWEGHRDRYAERLR